MLYTQKQIESCLKEAYSFENRAGWEKEDLPVEEIGSVMDNGQVRVLYVDSEGNYWYKTFFMTDHGLITEYEKIFGHPEKKIYLHKKI